MNLENLLKRQIWIVPAIFAFLIALIPTIQYQWPLSWDVIIHIQYAMVYIKYGLVLTDPLLNAPFGQQIGYPPLFHFLLAFLGMVTQIDLFQIARALQPFLAMFIVLSVSYVARKFYGSIAGISAGFLILSSVLLGRILLPIPENLALIFLPLSVYLYYRSIKDNRLKYAFFSGILFVTVILTHQVASLILLLIISVISLVELVVYRDIHVLKNYGTFLLLLVCLVVVGVIGLLLWQPDIIYSIYNQGITSVTGLFILSSNRPLNIRGYLDIGYLVLIFAITGIIFSLKKLKRKDLFILTWILLMFLISIAYWFGINVISYRLLVYLLLPLSIMGGFGLSEIYQNLKSYERFSLDKFAWIFLVMVFIISIVSGILTVEDPDLAVFAVENQYGKVEIAPPSTSMVDLAAWFNSHGNKSKSIMTNNLFTGTYLATVTGMPIHYGFEDFNKNITQSAFNDAQIGYLVLDKRLSLSENSETLQLIPVKSEFYPLVYFSKPISSNLDELLPDFIKVVYENQDYIVCQIME